MKSTTIIAILTIVFFACNQPTQTGTAASAADTSQHMQADMHNAQNSLDWAGTYMGTVPCGDCPGIETTLELKKDNSYTLKIKYTGKSDSTYSYNGSFTWNEAGNIVKLDNLTNIPQLYMVGEGYVKEADLGGNPITGALADKYILKKQ